MSKDSSFPAIGIRRSALETILAEAARAAPEECCGLLLGHGNRVEQAVPVPNVAANRLRHFELDPQHLVDAWRSARNGCPQVLGHYHSHPTGSALPSATDRAAANGDGQLWAITGGGNLTIWRAEGEGLENISYAIFKE